ncbi:MAG: hypothetical protein ACTHKC_09065 [Candidatus Nitrosocosmicus sp.]
MAEFIPRNAFALLLLLSLAVVSLEINENNNNTSLSPYILAQIASSSAQKQQQLPSPFPSVNLQPPITPPSSSSSFSQSPLTTPNQQLSPLQMASSTNKSCALTPSLIESEGTPQQTEGPYFVAGMPLRSNITYDTSDGSIQQGIPLHIVLHVFTVTGKNAIQNMASSNSNIKNTSANVCTPLSGARVDVWHANPQGVYSSIQNQNTVGKNFLRGYQITDKNGTVSFDTIYPGWYEGRAIHIHMKVSSFQGPIEKSDWTSQLYLNDSINQLVHTRPPYSNHGPVPLTNSQDLIYAGPSTDGLVKSDTGEHLMLNLVKNKSGYIGTFDIILNSPLTTK